MKKLLTAVLTLASLSQAQTTSKVCQLTGADDRDALGLPTGAERSGITGGVTGTDIGFSFEFNQRLMFLFGDSREFGRDLCEPGLCGPSEAPITLTQPDVSQVQRWRTQSDWDSFTDARGDGWDSIGTAPLTFDPDNCIPVSFATINSGLVYSQQISENGVAIPTQLTGAPVATNPQDKWVLALGNRLLVITTNGSVFAHQLTGNTIQPAQQLTAPPVAANPGDKWVLTADNKILVITSDGKVFAHAVTGDTVAPAYQLAGPPVASHPQDHFVFYLSGRIFVITSDGRVFAHQLTGNTIQPAQQLSAPKVAANPQDRWVLPINGNITVITKSGGVFVHPLSGNTVQPAHEQIGPLIIASPRAERVLIMSDRLLVLTGADGKFRPTKLDNKPLARSEGAFSAFINGASIYTFFSLRNRPIGCPPRIPGDGCQHDQKDADGKPLAGGKLVLAKSTDAGVSFNSLTTFSATKFLWAVPEIRPAANFTSLPPDVAGQAVFVFGAGRKNNDKPAGVALWGRSYPFLAVASLANFGETDGSVFAHDVSDSAVTPAIQLTAPVVAAQPQDKWVLTLGNRILVITSDGRVFAHDLQGNTVGNPHQLTGPIVAANPQDKYVLALGNRILVITTDGRVFVHEINGNTIGVPFQLSAPKVAANPQDKYVLVMDNRILVITQTGQVFAHPVNGNVIGNAIQWSGPLVAANPPDKHVLVMGNRLLVITASGQVFVHNINGNTIQAPFQLTAPPVATRPMDKWLLVNGNRILVITRQHWNFFTGLSQSGQPTWSDEEAVAAPVAPFGAPTQNGPGYHECFGYFSVHYIETWRKWAMLYTCGNDPKAGYNPNNGPRGVILRTAALPWGPWSAPQLVFNPDNGYCAFMHNQDADYDSRCNGKGTNPLEESVRAIGVTSQGQPTNKRDWAGEYAPLLLPSRYVKTDANGGITFYFEMSTWNPYQVVLLRTHLDRIP